MCAGQCVSCSAQHGHGLLHFQCGTQTPGQRWDDVTKACSGMKQGSPRWPQSGIRHQHPWGSLGKHSTNAWQHTRACSAHLSFPTSQPHAASSALSQPAQGCATFASLSPVNNSTVVTSSFPSPMPRDRSPAEHPQQVLSEPCTLRASSPCRTHTTSPALAQLQLQSRSYLALIKNIPHLKEPKGCFLSTALSWRGFEGCRPHPAKYAGHHRLRPRPDGGHSATQGLFLVPVKKERQGAGGRQCAARYPAGPRGGNGSRARPGHSPPAPLACVPTRDGDGCLALVPAPVGNNKRDADPRAP